MTRAEAALRRAVAEIAAEKPITNVTVSEVCRRAGITRDSFYRFAPSAVALLTAYLYDDHDTTLVTPIASSHDSGLWTLRPATLVLLQHVQRNRRIYRNALTPGLPAELREALLRRLEEVLFARARALPGKLPDIEGKRPNADEVAALIHFQSNGVVGILEYLVGSDLIDDLEHCTAIILASTAPWWQSNEMNE